MGINAFTALSNGILVKNPKYLKQSEKQLKKAHQRLSRKKKGSSNRAKARNTLATLHGKVRNQRTDFQHKLSRKLVNAYAVIVAEKLNIINMVRNHHLAKSISDASWASFLFMLTYKAEEAGSKFLQVDPKYSSIACSRCGSEVPKTLKDRVHNCPHCHLVLDRDVNATINILHKGMIQLREEQLANC